MSTTNSHRLLSRLHRDLTELLDQPYPGVTVFTDGADIRKFCLVLTPPSGPWMGLNLHFNVTLPPTWPKSPPTVHPVCCHLLNPMTVLEKGYTGGYTPALTLRGLFLQFLTFFSSTKIEQHDGNIPVNIGDYSTVVYMEERDLVPLQHPWERCCDRGISCTCSSLRANHHTLESTWNSDSSADVTVFTHKTPSGNVVQSVKSTQPHPRRIHKFEKVNWRRTTTLKQIQHWCCIKCPYGSENLPHIQPQRTLDVAVRRENEHILPFLVPPSSCQIDRLSDDALIELSHFLSSETLVLLGEAYPRFQVLVTFYHLRLQRDLHCFFLKIHLHEGILGIGVAFNERTRMLSSDFDWLSMEAFDAHGVRQSVQKRAFQFFLPLAFNQAHFDRAKSAIWKRLGLINGAMLQAENKRNERGGPERGRGRGHGRGDAPWRTERPMVNPRPSQPHDAIKVVYKMMNSIVVSLMKSCDETYNTPRHGSSPSGVSIASEKAIISYCHLMHLLACLSRGNPAVLSDAVSRLQIFVKSPDNRRKAVEPDLGELIVAVNLALIMSPTDKNDIPTWSMFSEPFFEEALIRNVRWALKDAPELEVMEEGCSNYQLSITFEKSKTSIRLLMFQVSFLGLFMEMYRSVGIQALDANYGFPVKQLPEMMLEEIKGIYKVDSWPGYFGKVQWTKAQSLSKEQLTDVLMIAIRKSRDLGYHQPALPSQLERLRQVRRSLEANATA